MHGLCAHTPNSRVNDANSGREKQAGSMTAQHHAPKHHQHNSAQHFAVHDAAATNQSSPVAPELVQSGTDSSRHMHGLLHVP